ncbi:MAG: hypothetical protein U0797_17345 [Gemmataceae bacterium]
MATPAEPDHHRPSPLWRRLLAGALVLAAVVAAILVANWASGSRSGAARLQAILDDLDKADPNWRLHEIEAAREEVPAPENSALVVVAVARALPRPWPSEAVGKLLAPPRALLEGGR